MAEPVWIMDKVMLAAHRQQLALHALPHLSIDRIRLSAALMWPRSLLLLAGGPVRLMTLAAAHVAAILRLRPFGAGNERAAYLAGMLFLGLNGVFLRAPPAEKWSMVVALAQGRLSLDAYAEWLELRQLAGRFPADRTRQVVRLRVRKDSGTVIGMSRLDMRPQPAAVPAPAPAEDLPRPELPD